MKKILIAEDDFVQRTLLLTTLQEKGYEVYACESASQALFFYRKHTIDFVITDIYLLDMDGFDLLHSLQGVNPEVRVLAMTSNPSTTYLNIGEMALRNGFSAFMTKPLNLMELDQNLLEFA